MVELFTNIPQPIKRQISQFVDFIIENFQPQQGSKMLADFANSSLTEEEKNFIDFYISYKTERILNENNNDFRA